MEAKSTDRKTFQLLDKEQVKGEVIYENLFKLKGSIKLANSDEYEIKTEGVFSTSIHVIHQGTKFASLKMNWRGQIVIAFESGEQYILRSKGVFHNFYVLENEAHEPLIQYDPTFEWSKFNYKYAISFNENPQCDLLILLGVFASNYYIATMSGATAGIV
jgi:hypothetical protein